MNWTTFWQVFILVPWCMMWIAVPVGAIRKVTNNYLGTPNS